MTYHATTPAIKAAPTNAPTTPPAIAPEFELLWEVEVGDEPDPVVLGFRVDWEAVNIGTMEAVPVTSGESPRACAAEMFQLLPVNVSIYAHLGTRVPSGTGFGKVPGVATDVQLNDH
jgi:hypothetical protein